MRRYAVAFDPSTLSGVEADSVVAAAGTIERMAAAVKGMAAARSAGEGMWKVSGDRSAAHRTVFDLLDRLCSHHHDRKTIDNWALVAGHGKRAFVPPEDRRHPRHAPPVAA